MDTRVHPLARSDVAVHVFALDCNPARRAGFSAKDELALVSRSRTQDDRISECRDVERLLKTDRGSVRSLCGLPGHRVFGGRYIEISRYCLAGRNTQSKKGRHHKDKLARTYLHK